MQVSRRHFLGGLTAAGLIQALWAKPSRAEELPGIAKRLVVFFSPNGTIHHQRRPTGTGSSFGFPAGSILEPLSDIRDKLIVVDGLDFHGASNHEGGMASCLTGTGRLGDPGNGASVDQYIAGMLARNTPLPSLSLGVQTSLWGGGTQTRMSYADAGTMVTPDDDPNSVFRRLFGEVDLDLAARMRMRTFRGRILDLARQDLVRLHDVASAAQRARLEQHLDALDAVEVGLDPMQPGTCSSPQPPLMVDNLRDHASFGTIGRQQTDLLVAALACGMTDVATLQWSHTVAPQVLSFLGLSDGHHTLSHAGDGDSRGVEDFVTAERWFAEQFRYLVDQLDQTAAPEGGTLLDHTLVVWAKEMGDSRLHVCDDVPFVLAGSAGGRWETGRYLRYDGEPHNQLLVSICQAMGLSDDAFGNPSYGTGALAGLV
jgi:hypothetical protein